MATSRPVLARGSAEMPRAAARSEIVAASAPSRSVSPSGVVAGEAHVQAPVAEVEIGVVVGRLRQRRRSPRRRRPRRRRSGPRTTPRSPAARCASRAGRSGGRTPPRCSRSAMPCDRSQDRSVRNVPQAQALGRRDRSGRRPVAGPQDRADVARSDLRVTGGDDRAHDRAHHLVAEGGRLDLEAQHPLPEVRPPRSADPPDQRRRARRPAGAFGRRQNALKSCSPRNGSQASVSSSRSRGTGTCHDVVARNGSGTGRFSTV